MGKKNIKNKWRVFSGESNPFNMQINRQKHATLGVEKKGTKGFREISRAASFAKRQSSFRRIKEATGKANTFVYNRMGGSSEEALTSRMAQERMKKFKKNIFNLNDEDLTHKGVPLKAVETFEQGEIETDVGEALQDKFVSDTHFGGFDSTAKGSASTSVNDLIAESKRNKYEKTMEKEENLELANKLDQQWKDSLTMLSELNSEKPPAPTKKDPFEIFVNEMRFEPMAIPVWKTKEAEEIEEEKVATIEKLEKERLNRMKDTKISKRDYISADDIVYDFDFDAPSMKIQEDHSELPTPKNEWDNNDYDDNSDWSDESSNAGELEMQRNNTAVNSELEVSSYQFNSYEDFKAVIENPNDNMYAVIEKMAKTPPKRFINSEKVVQKFASTFKFLISYAIEKIHELPLFPGEIVPHLHNLTVAAPVECGNIMLSLLNEEEQLFLKSKELKKKKDFPRKETLLLLKYVSTLYSVSDFKHPIVTPTVYFMCEILWSRYHATYQNIIARLYVCQILSDTACPTKRYIAEPLYFLNNTLLLALPDTKSIDAALSNTCPYFTPDKHPKMFPLFISDGELVVEPTTIDMKDSDNSFADSSKKLNVIFKIVSLLQQFADMYMHLQGFSSIFSQTASVLSKLPVERYPKTLKNLVLSLVQKIKDHKTTYIPLQFIKRKPKPLKMFEPLFASQYNVKTAKDLYFKKAMDAKRVQRKLRKEERNTLREIRRDAQVVSAEMLKQRLEADADRKRKLKEIYHNLATQEGEYKKMMREKEGK